MQTIRIGTRGSALALWQAEFAQQALVQLGYTTKLQIISTKGDRQQSLSFDKIEGKGFFTKEIEDALLNGDIDLAIHSYKDLPTESVPQLRIAANSYREQPNDCLIIAPHAYDPMATLLPIKEGAIVGTSSVRRKAQLAALRPDLRFNDIRGNVATRIQKIDKNECDAVMLAAAGIARLELDMTAYQVVLLPPQQCVPAPAQGVLAYQIRENDVVMAQIAAQLHQHSVGEVIGIERQILHDLEGGCRRPIGVFCQHTPEKGYEIWASMASDWREFPKRVYLCTPTANEAVPAVLHALHSQRAGQKLFISRQVSTDSYLFRALSSYGYSIISESLLTLTPVAFDADIVTRHADWLFFSSRNAAAFFFDQLPPNWQLPRQIQIGAVGNGTADIIRKYGYSLDFIGHEADIIGVGESFNAKANQTVVFPQAANSLRTVQQQIETSSHVVDIVVYDNRPRTNWELPYCEVLVFTSPLNVQAYCKMRAIEPSQTVVAIGHSTAAALRQHGCTHYRVAYAPTEADIADLCW